MLKASTKPRHKSSTKAQLSHSPTASPRHLSTLRKSKSGGNTGNKSSTTKRTLSLKKRSFSSTHHSQHTHPSLAPSSLQHSPSSLTPTALFTSTTPSRDNGFFSSLFRPKQSSDISHEEQQRLQCRHPPPQYRGPRRSADDMYPLYPISPIRTVPDHIPRPDYSDYQHGSPTIRDRNAQIAIKTPAEIEEMRESCAIASYIRAFAGKLVRPGISLDEIDAQTHDEVVRLGVYPSPLGYYNFPKCIATSINNVVCHAIPDGRVLTEGDILNIDVSIFTNGFHGDCSGMFVAGDCDESAKQLIATTERSMNNAIAICRNNQPFNQIGAEIEKEAAKYNYGINQVFNGHGIGRLFHEQPTIWHRANNAPGVMKTGMTFTIEPILIESPFVEYVQHNDGWAILTVDGSRTAQFEQTVLVLDRGSEILTQHKEGYYDKKL